MEEIRCIFCGRESDYVAVRDSGYTGKKCLECGLIYVSPRPALDEIIELYSEDSAHSSGESHIAGSYPKRLYARHKLSIIRRYVRSGSLLELGPGAGHFLDEARKAGFDACGIEPNRMLADYINNVLKISCESEPLSESSFAGRIFDVIYHCDVISHFHDPIAEFGKLRGRLSEGGYMIFETGNLGDVAQRHLDAFREYYYPDHLFFFSERSLRDLLRRTGFECVGVFRYSLAPQMLFTRTVESLVACIRRSRGSKPDSRQTEIGAASGVVTSVTGRRRLKRLARLAYDHLVFCTRYKLGRIAPRKGRPQTLILVTVARSRDNHRA